MDKLTLDPQILRGLAEALRRYCALQEEVLDSYMKNVYALQDRWIDDRDIPKLMEEVRLLTNKSKDYFQLLSADYAALFEAKAEQIEHRPEFDGGGYVAGGSGGYSGGSGGNVGSADNGSVGGDSIGGSTPAADAWQDLQDYGNFYMDSISDAQRNAICEFADMGGHGEINDYLWGKTDGISPEGKERGSLLWTAMEGATTPCDCVVYCGMNPYMREAWSSYSDQELIGQTLVEQSFLCASMNLEATLRTSDTVMVIRVPQGANGCYVGKVSHIATEWGGFLFNAGQSLRVQDVFRDEEGRRGIIVNMLVDQGAGQQGNMESNMGMSMGWEMDEGRSRHR